MLNKDTIVKLLATNSKAVARALVLLNNRQTTDEQASENTRYLNGRGFRPCHARMGTSMAKFFERNGYLSPKQLAYWRVRDKTGSMRIGIYWAQLLEEAEIKQKKAATRDLGNDMERRLILADRLGDVLDSDDPGVIGPIADEIDEIDQYWKKIQQLNNGET